MDRRNFLQGLGGAALLTAAPAALAMKKSGDPGLSTDRFAAIERESGGRLGVAVLDTGTGLRFGWRDEERFPMCSTFKFLLVAAVLRRVDSGKEELERRIPIRKEDLVIHSPVAERNLGPQGMSVAELCEATMTLSDNAAANLLLPTVGGPAGLTRFVRELGDAHTRLDRNEPSLNTATPGDERDTTLPRAMVDHLQRIALGDVLQSASRDRLTGWLLGNRTGDSRLRAGLPQGWRVGDKTGSGENGTTNDIAIVWPQDRPPLLLACYLTGSFPESKRRDRILQSVALEVSRLEGDAGN